MIVVVLDHPQDLVNIAHVVRAMKNFGAGDLRLVAPAEYDAYRVEGIAHRTGDILGRVRQFNTLTEALADCVYVVACSARGRTLKHTTVRPREIAADLLARAVGGPVAVLFGREDRGLDNEALEMAHQVVTIPSNPEYSSLNLGHAAVIMLYELALARGAEEQPRKGPRRSAGPATVAELEHLSQVAEAALDAIGFFKAHTRVQILHTLREVAHRAGLDQREAKLLAAMSYEVQKRAGKLESRRVGELES